MGETCSYCECDLDHHYLTESKLSGCANCGKCSGFKN